MRLFVLPRQPFNIPSKELLQRLNANIFSLEPWLLTEGCLLFPPRRKPLEMFTSRARCTALWRQILVMFLNFIRKKLHGLIWLVAKTWKYNPVVVITFTGKKQCFVCADFVSLFHCSPPLFISSSCFSEKYICYGEQSHAVLKKLSELGKKMFLITNSPFDFV